MSPLLPEYTPGPTDSTAFYPATDAFRPRPSRERALRQRQAQVQLTRPRAPGATDLGSALREITRVAAEALEVERVSIWLFNADKTALRLQTLFLRSAGRHTEGVELKVSDYPAYFKAIRDNEVVAAHDAQRDARTREFTQGYLAPLRITSMLDAPLFLEGGIAGVVCSEQVGPPRIWNDDEQTFAVTIASLVTLAIGQEKRREAEAALATSELRYRLVARATGDVIWDWDLLTGGVKWNDALSTVFGHAMTDVEPDARWWFANVHPDDRDRVRTCLKHVIDGGGDWSDDYRFRRGDGSYAHVFDRGTVIRDAAGRPARMIGAMMDLTARKESERALREAQERLRELAENIQEVFWLRDVKSGRFVYVSPAFDGIWGRPRQALLENPDVWADSLHPQDRARVLAGAQQSTPYGGEFAEYRIVRPDGSVRWIRDRAFPVRNEKGEIYRMAGVADDMTTRKAGEEALRFQKCLLEAQTEAAQDGILVVSGEGKVISHNRRLSKLWEIPADVVASASEQSILNFILGKLAHPKEFLARVRHLHNHPDDVSAEEVLLSDGRVFDHYTAPVLAQGRGFYGRVWFFRDVTARKRLEAQLRQGQKMEAIGRLAGGVAHDFNNLLTAILGYSDVLASKLAGNEGLLADLAEIKQSGERAASLTSQLLAFSRQQTVQPKVLDLNRVVVKMEKMLRRLIGEDVDLRTELAPKLWSVKADAVQMDQVLMNLSVNARDAMPRGGRLTIETRDVVIDSAFVQEHPGAATGPHVLIRVSDTGMGMRKEVLAHCFEPFFTTKEAGKGTGLGLATVYGIIKQNGGYVGVRSEEGRGTSFEIYLPRVAEAPSGASDTVALPCIPGSGRVLLVEDEAVVRRLVRQTLKNYGYNVVEAVNGVEALKVVTEDAGAFDLVITDLVMPEMGGRDLALKLRERWPEVPVLYMSGYTEDAAIRQGGLESDAILLHKPFSPNEMLNKVRKSLQLATRGKAAVRN
ncbi:MAG TPA: PAS domain-containing protein [Planctomycetota bacterium]